MFLWNSVKWYFGLSPGVLTTFFSSIQKNLRKWLRVINLSHFLRIELGRADLVEKNALVLIAGIRLPVTELVVQQQQTVRIVADQRETLDVAREERFFFDLFGDEPLQEDLRGSV